MRMSMTRCSRLVSVVAGLLVSAGTHATDVRVSGLFTDKAVVQIDGGRLQTLSVGQKSAEGVTLVRSLPEVEALFAG